MSPGEQSAHPGRGSTLWRVIRIAAFPAIALGVFAGALPHVADLDEVWRLISGMTVGQVAILAGLTIWNVLTYWPVQMAGMPGLSLGRAAVVTQTSGSVAMTVPGGGAFAVAVSYRMYVSWGFRPGEVALVTLATGIANFAVKLALPVIAVALVAAQGDGTGELVRSALTGVAVLAGTGVVVGMVLRRGRAARWLGSAVGRAARFARREDDGDWGESAERLRERLVSLLRRRWAALAATSALSQVSVFLVMLASLRFAGVASADVSWGRALAVFALVRLASAVPIVPGNVGLAELGYIGGLLVAGGHRTTVVAAVLVFRFLTYFLQIPLGGATYLVWRRGLRPGRPPFQITAPSPEDQERAGRDGGAPNEGRAPQRDLGVTEHGTRGQDERSSVPSP